MFRSSLRLSHLFLSATVATSLFAPARAHAEDQAEAPEAAVQDADARREAEDRALLAGSEAGALKNPIRLTEEAQVERICSDLMGPIRARGPQKEGRRAALRNVFSVTVQPGGFKVGDYRAKSGTLPLRLEHPLIALDGALRLVIVQRAGGALPVPAADAAALTAAVEAKRVALEVVFRVDGEGGASMAPCYSYQRSAAYALNAEPLAYTLIEGEKRIATRTTPAHEELERWVSPGKASLSVEAEVDGGGDSTALTKAIESKRSELESCASPVMSTPAGTGVVSFDVTLGSDGTLGSPRLQAEAIENGAEISACFGKVLAAVRGPRERSPTRVHVTFSVERGEDDGVEVTD